MVRFKHHFPAFEHDQLSQEVYQLISAEPALNPRTPTFYLSLLNQHRLVLGFDSKQLVTVIGVRPLTKTHAELVSWYTRPQYRRQGIGKAIFAYTLSHFQGPFIAASFSSNTIPYLIKSGFQPVALHRLPFPLLFSILITRNYRSVVRHFSQTKSTWWWKA